MFGWFEATASPSVWFWVLGGDELSVWHWWGLRAATCLAGTAVMRACLKLGILSCVTWHPGPSPASRSSSLARRAKKLEGTMWEASQSTCEGLPCCSSGLFFACSHLHPAFTQGKKHTRTLTFILRDDVTLLEWETDSWWCKKSDTTVTLTLDVAVGRHHLRWRHLSETGRTLKIHLNAAHSWIK